MNRLSRQVGLCCLWMGLMTLISGCFTAATASRIVRPETDSFYPHTLYKSTNDGGVAIEGSWANEEKFFHGFLIVPEKVLLAAHRRTGGDITFDDLAALSPEVRKELQVKRKLPSGYEKIYDFPRGQTDLVLNKTTRVHIASVGALPFTLAIDAVTLPVQVPLLLYVGHQLKDVH